MKTIRRMAPLFLMILGITCFALTVAAWIQSHVAPASWSAGDPNLESSNYLVGLRYDSGKFLLHMEHRHEWEPWLFTKQWSFSNDGTVRDYPGGPYSAECTQWHYQPDPPDPIVKYFGQDYVLFMARGYTVFSSQSVQHTPPTHQAERQIATIAAPLWVPTALFGGASALLFVPVFRDFRRSKRRRQGRCVQCGYDLRGSSTACSECGQPFGKISDSIETH